MERPRNVVFYPELPHPKATVMMVLAELGASPARRIDDRTVCAFQWKDATFYALADRAIELLSRVPLYNTACTDISKRNVARCNRMVFRRSLAVDPLSHQGPMVCKSDRNAAHDGYTVNGPLRDIDPARTYSRLIDNTAGADAVDYRVFVVGGRLPVVHLRRKPLQQRFANVGSWRVPVAACEAFSQDELRLLRAFSTAIGMDMGELDVLRDAKTGQVWVVDANNTPQFPVDRISTGNRRATVARLAAAFDAAFLTARAPARATEWS
jgi:hypothetical protein